MKSKGLTWLFLAGTAVFLSGCSLFPSGKEAPLIVVETPATPPAAIPNVSPPPVPAQTDETADVLPEEAAPTDGALEMATSTALLRVPTPTPTLTPTPTPEKPKLEIRSSSIKLAEDGKKYQIEGQIFNSGQNTADLTNFKIVAYLYDNKGKTVASSVGRLAQTALGPQDSTTFKITVGYLPGVENYKLQGGF